jgi:signal transduction histidine kinase
LGLRSALVALAERARVRHGIEVTTELDASLGLGSSLGLDSELEAVVYRVVQEALTNAGRHADADAVVVRLARQDGKVELSITDDGRGFDPARPTNGFGLVGMRERVALVGGQLELASSSAGTAVAVSLPATGSLVPNSPARRREPRY